jgi:hypothetical protein
VLCGVCVCVCVCRSFSLTHAHTHERAHAQVMSAAAVPRRPSQGADTPLPPISESSSDNAGEGDASIVSAAAKEEQRRAAAAGGAGAGGATPTGLAALRAPKPGVVMDNAAGVPRGRAREARLGVPNAPRARSHSPSPAADGSSRRGRDGGAGKDHGAVNALGGQGGARRGRSVSPAPRGGCQNDRPVKGMQRPSPLGVRCNRPCSRFASHVLMFKPTVIDQHNNGSLLGL